MPLRSRLRRMTRPAQRTQIRLHMTAAPRARHHMIHIERTSPATLSATRRSPQHPAPQPMPLRRQPRPISRPHRKPPKASPQTPRTAAKATQDASQPSVRIMRDKNPGHRLQNPYRIEQPHNGAVRGCAPRGRPRGGPAPFAVKSGADRAAAMAAAMGDETTGRRMRAGAGRRRCPGVK
jgi:hypothetical protein